MSYNNLLVEVSERIATVTINRPKVLNALSDATVVELDSCWTALERDNTVRAVIVTGSGEKAFIAGADISELATFSPRQAMESARRGQQMLARLEAIGKPTIAAINGLALGGGCELALACTLRLASANARIGQPEVKLGIPPGYGGTQRLPRLIGKGRAFQMLLTGEHVPAQLAYEWGLVNAVVPAEQLLTAARELARKMIANAPLALSYVLQAVHQGMEQPLEQALVLESSLFGLSFSTSDMREGMAAFLEKRAPSFSGR
jgi:enoyl-CoA hydratase